jgi:hypothetical protein
MPKSRFQSSPFVVEPPITNRWYQKKQGVVSLRLPDDMVAGSSADPTARRSPSIPIAMSTAAPAAGSLRCGRWQFLRACTGLRRLAEEVLRIKHPILGTSSKGCCTSLALLKPDWTIVLKQCDGTSATVIMESIGGGGASGDWSLVHEQAYDRSYRGGGAQAVKEAY